MQANSHESCRAMSRSYPIGLHDLCQSFISCSMNGPAPNKCVSLARRKHNLLSSEWCKIHESIETYSLVSQNWSRLFFYQAQQSILEKDRHFRFTTRRLLQHRIFDDGQSQPDRNRLWFSIKPYTSSLSASAKYWYKSKKICRSSGKILMYYTSVDIPQDWRFQYKWTPILLLCKMKLIKVAAIFAVLALVLVSQVHGAVQARNVQSADHVALDSSNSIFSRELPYSENQASQTPEAQSQKPFKKSEIVLPKMNTTSTAKMPEGAFSGKGVHKGSSCTVETYFCIRFIGVYIGAVFGSDCSSVLIYFHDDDCPNNFIQLWSPCPGLKYCVQIELLALR